MTIRVSTPADDVVALTDVAPIPGLGFLPVNAYVVRAEQPLLVDSGLPTSRPDFLRRCGPRSSRLICGGST